VTAGPDPTPFWHIAAPPEPPGAAAPPARAGIAVIGAGLTGLSAALALAEAGRHVLVLDAGPPGAGASTRNGGMIGWGHRARLAALARWHGEARARAILEGARQALDFTEGLIARLPGDCMYRRTGRFLAAASPRHFADLRHWAAQEAPRLGMEVRVVGPAEQGAHIETAAYHGGLVFPRHGLLHPGLFHRALLDAVRAAGGEVIGHCAVTGISGGPGAWRLVHARGETSAAELVHAGNGYSGGPGGVLPALGRRLLAIPSFMIATEPVGRARLARLLPQGQGIVDTRAVHSYFRPDPAGERLLWGGRAALSPLGPAQAARHLRDHMLSVFPDLADLGIARSWSGFVAFTRDGVAHLGRTDGVWHASGYNGSGVALAPWLGWRLAERLLGRTGDAGGFDGAVFPPFPLYRAAPVALRALDLWYRHRERRHGVARITRHS